MAYAAPARHGARQGAWPRRIGGAVSTGVVLATLVALWRLAGPAGMEPRASDRPPLQLVEVALPPPVSPTPTPTPTPTPERRHPAPRPHGAGGHRAGPRASGPIRPVPPRAGGGDAVNATREALAPPRPIVLPDSLSLADTLPAGSLGTALAAATAGMGPDAGAGSGTGSGRGSGEGPGAGDAIYLRPDWIVKPTEAMLSPYWPSTVGRTHRPGRVVLACRVRLSTRVHACRVLAERPAGAGLGAASLAASRIFRVRPPRRNGIPIDDAWVFVPIDWIVLSPSARREATATATPATASAPAPSGPAPSNPPTP